MSVEQAPAQSRFSRSELREIVRITNHPSTQRVFAAATHSLRLLLESDPGASWEDFANSSPASLLEGRGAGLLKESLRRFQGASQAVAYWRARYERSPQYTRRIIRQHLAIPPRARISRVLFLQDCCALVMGTMEANIYWRHRQARLGIEVTKGEIIAGFVSESLFLGDGRGNQCGVMVIGGRQEIFHSMLAHEREHVVFGEHYDRQPYTTLPEQAVNLRKAVKQEVGQILAGKEEPGDVLDTVGGYLQKHLAPYSRLFLNEIIATKRGGYSKGQSAKDLVGSFVPYETRRVASQHPYGNHLRQVIDGVLDAVEQTDLQDKDKLKTWWEIERTVSIFCNQNLVIASWIDTLWEVVGKDLIKFASTLESIPASRLWNIGWFISEDPRKLRQQLISTGPRNAHHKGGEQVYILWPMAVRFVREQAKPLYARLRDLGEGSIQLPKDHPLYEKLRRIQAETQALNFGKKPFVKIKNGPMTAKELLIAELYLAGIVFRKSLREAGIDARTPVRVGGGARRRRNIRERSTLLMFEDAAKELAEEFWPEHTATVHDFGEPVVRTRRYKKG